VNDKERRDLHRVLWSIAVVLTLLAALAAVRAPAWPVAFAPQDQPQACIGKLLFQVDRLHIARPGFAHALSAVMLRDGRMRAVWYEGSRELDPYVQIWTAIFDGEAWSAPRAIIGATGTGFHIGRYVRKLGNSLIYRDAGGDLVILYAGLIGGWDTASLNLMRSRDDGETWSPPRHLTTTPIFNLGTNVRGPAVQNADGSTLVPASHEFLRPFPEVLLLDRDGRVIGRRRIGVKFHGSQPFVLVLDDRRARSFSRAKFDGYTITNMTDDVGWSWTPPKELTLPNYDKPVAVARLGGRNLLMIHNGAAAGELAANRRLMFSVSDDEGETWRPLHYLDFETHRNMRAHYPWLMAGPGGLYHLLFTLSNVEQGSELIHVRFSRDWIAGQGGPACP
jgi:predicted neuraminidase